MRNSFKFFFILFFSVLFVESSAQNKQSIDSSLYNLHSISGNITPKSVVHNGAGIFFAQNMMYKHTITVYNRKFDLLKTIDDKVDGSAFGWDRYTKTIAGGPVECCFSPDGKYAWVSNYNMTGGGVKYFNNPGCDGCRGSKYDSSFVYKINTKTLDIESIIQVGAIPKYLASTPDGELVLVTNWTSGDMSIIDVSQNREVKRIKLGAFPRGIAVDSKSKYAYISIMGSYEVVKLNLKNYTKTEIKVGRGPRHLCISPDDKYLYITLNSENRIGKLDLSTLELHKVRAGHQPRSMTIDKNGKYLYVVNYNDANFTKYDAVNMLPIAITKTKSKPIGITYDNREGNVWVACYSGYIQVFKDSLIRSKKSYEVSIGKEKEVAERTGSKVTISTLLDSNAIPKEPKIILAKRYEPSFQFVKKDFSANMIRFLQKKEEAILLAQNKEKEEKIKKEQKTLSTENLELDNLNVEKFSAKNGKFLVVLGAFGKSNNVSKLQTKMKKKGISTLTYYNPLKKVTYVCAGQYKNRSLADTKSNELNKQEIDSWIFTGAK